MRQFLLVYDRSSGELVSMESFDEDKRSDALHHRSRLEIEYGDQSEIEVVLLSAASLDDLKKTHSRYFESLEAMISDAAASTP